MAYFYVIYSKTESRFYAGFRSYDNSEELLKEDGYLTSSNLVKSKIKKYGLCDFSILRIREFDSKEKAYAYETRFLEKVDARNNPKFYNKHNNNFKSYSSISNELSDETKKLISENIKSVKRVTCEYCSKELDYYNYKRWHGVACIKNPDSDLGKERRERLGNLISSSYDDEKRKLYSDRQKERMNNYYENISEEEMNSRIEKYRNSLTEESRRKMSDTLAKTIEKYGNPMSNEVSRNKVSQSKVGRKKFISVRTGKGIYAKPGDPRLESGEWILSSQL